MIQVIFNIPYDERLPDVDDAEIRATLEEIENGNYEHLLDHNILPSNDVDARKRLFTITHVILSNMGSIQQFADGLASIDHFFIKSESFEVMKNFLLPNSSSLRLEELMNWLEFRRDNEEESSNMGKRITNAICDFEMYLAAVSNKEVRDVSLKDVLFLFTGLERVPPFVLQKNIEVFFSAEKNSPSISTCALAATFPLNDVAKALQMALSFGGGLGTV